MRQPVHAFCPDWTPLYVPVLTSFILRDKAYVVDVQGSLFQIQVEGDDPDLWVWQLMVEL